MVQVRVFVSSFSAERLWDIEKPIPQVKVSTNLNVVGINEKSEDMLEVPYVFTINYNPAVAQISLKGKSHVRGSKGELEKISENYKKKMPPPPVIIQSISNIVFLESVIICRTLNIPPPIPLPKFPPTGKSKQTEPTYRA